jgi:THO complex subunit 2
VLEKEDEIRDRAKMLGTRRTLLEYARAVAAGTVAPRSLSTLVTLLTEAPTPDLVADIIWFAWVELEALPVTPLETNSVADRKARLTRMAVEALSLTLTTKQHLMQRSEGDFMEQIGFEKADVWRKKEIKANTRRVYTQKKFNLLREESEGYSKLITLLSQAGSGAISVTGLDHVVSVISIEHGVHYSMLFVHVSH